MGHGQAVCPTGESCPEDAIQGVAAIPPKGQGLEACSTSLAMTSSSGASSAAGSRFPETPGGWARGEGVTLPLVDVVPQVCLWSQCRTGIPLARRQADLLPPSPLCHPSHHTCWLLLLSSVPGRCFHNAVLTSACRTPCPLLKMPQDALSFVGLLT